MPFPGEALPKYEPHADLWSKTMGRKKTERRRSTNRYEALNEPQGILDFHGDHSITGQQVKHQTIAFIQKSVESGHHRVRIITGKGVHSKGDPIVSPQVHRTLQSLVEEGLVRNYRTENDHDGGKGAYRVDLIT